MKIAVVGAGLSGLAAAWLLGRRHAVTLFERQPRPGFTAASVTAPAGGPPSGAPLDARLDVRVDVPLRVFYPGYYPTLTRLYHALGVASEPVSYAGAFSGADGRLYFRYHNLRLGARSWAVLAPQDLLLGARAWHIVAGMLRFQRDAQAGPVSGSIGAFVTRQAYPSAFVDGFLLPAIATVCTCTYAQAREFPAAVIIDYLARGLSRQSVHRACGGADDVERRLLAGIADLRCDARIAGIARGADGVVLQLADGSRTRFDQLVLATQANQARRLLHDASVDEATMLDAFRYSPVAVVTHSDPALMPARRRDWSPVNLRVAAGQDGPESTIWVNAVQPALRDAPDLFQTVHPQRAPRPDRVIGQTLFERPVVDAGSQAGLQTLQRLHAERGRRVWFCGSYAQAGIPLLESAVRSAHDVAAALGADLS
jgi:predicted NAD/FAD-binding protein